MQNNENKPKGAGKSSFGLIDPAVLTEMLPIKPGAVVLDLACGRGDYSLFLSGIVGEHGIVYAVDLWEDGIRILNQAIESGKITNILPLVNDASREIDVDEYHVDVCLMATVLHDFEEAGQAGAVLENVKVLLKPGGWLGIIEFKKMQGPPGPPIGIRLSGEEVEDLVTPHGFKKRDMRNLGEFTYLMTFREKDIPAISS